MKFPSAAAADGLGGGVIAGTEAAGGSPELRQAPTWDEASWATCGHVPALGTSKLPSETCFLMAQFALDGGCVQAGLLW